MKPLLVGLELGIVMIVAVTAQMPKYGVSVKAEKGVDFAKITTYAWTPGQPSAVKEIDARIVAAVDHELHELGLTPAAPGAADVLTTYFSLTRTDVDLKAKPDAAGLHPQYAVGTLIVALLDPASRKRLLRLRIDKPIETTPAQLGETIDTAVAAMFEKYPTRQSK
jgi:hypothetical protein